MTELRISQSEISTFERCKRQWWLNDYRGLAPIREAAHGTRALGTRCHAALQALYQGKSWNEQLIRDAVEDMANDPTAEDAIRKDTELAQIMLEGYVEWLETDAADADYEVIGAEDEIEVPLPSVPGVILVGKLDLRVRRRSDGAKLFIDHKIVGTLKDLPKTAAIARQFRHYSLLERLTTSDSDAWCDGGVYNMLLKSKRTARATPPFFERMEVRHNETDLISYYKQVTRIAQEIVALRARIESGEFDQSVDTRPNPTSECKWICPFLRLCPMFDDGGDPESVLSIAFTQRDPMERYTQQEESI